MTTIGSFRPWLAVLLVLLAGCGVTRHHRRPRMATPSLETIPEIEEFEPILERKGGLIEALFAIDEFVEPDSDLPKARESYRSLLAKVRPLVEKALPVGGAHGAALEVLGYLRAAEFRYDDEKDELAPQFGSISRCLLARRGICLSFSLLGMALLESCGVDSWVTCYPRHVLLRIRKGEREIELESTTFGDPVAAVYPEDLGARADGAGFLYARSLDRTAAAWCYLAERLWVWVLKRSKDERSFALLDRAEEILRGSDESTSLQWALRHYLRSSYSLCTPAERAESFKAAVDEFERLIRWDSSHAVNYLFLSALFEQAGRKRDALEVLKRFMDTTPGERRAVDVFVQARWWIKRQEFRIEGFLLTPEEMKQSEAYLDRHFPFSDRPQQLEFAYRRMFEPNRR